MRARHGAAALVFFFVAACTNADAGGGGAAAGPAPQVGGACAPFDVIDVTGPNKGKTLCYV